MEKKLVINIFQNTTQEDRTFVSGHILGCTQGLTFKKKSWISDFVVKKI